MKKIVFLIITALVLFTSCQKENVKACRYQKVNILESGPLYTSTIYEYTIYTDDLTRTPYEQYCELCELWKDESDPGYIWNENRHEVRIGETNECTEWVEMKPVIVPPGPAK